MDCKFLLARRRQFCEEYKFLALSRLSVRYNFGKANSKFRQGMLRASSRNNKVDTGRSNNGSARSSGQEVDESLGLSPGSSGLLDAAVAKQLADIAAFGPVNVVEQSACGSLIVNDEGLTTVCTKDSEAKYARNAVDFATGEEFVTAQCRGCRNLPWTSKSINGPEAVVGEYAGAAEGVGLKGIASTPLLDLISALPVDAQYGVSVIEAWYGSDILPEISGYSFEALRTEIDERWEGEAAEEVEQPSSGWWFRRFL